MEGDDHDQDAPAMARDGRTTRRARTTTTTRAEDEERVCCVVADDTGHVNGRELDVCDVDRQLQVTVIAQLVGDHQAIIAQAAGDHRHDERTIALEYP